MTINKKSYGTCKKIQPCPASLTRLALNRNWRGDILAVLCWKEKDIIQKCVFPQKKQKSQTAAFAPLASGRLLIFLFPFQNSMWMNIPLDHGLIHYNYAQPIEI